MGFSERMQAACSWYQWWFSKQLTAGSCWYQLEPLIGTNWNLLDFPSGLSKNAWLQHFDPLGGPPIEIVWAWVTCERIKALEPITDGLKMPGYSTLICSVVAP
jgi:hypothetical protein